MPKNLNAKMTATYTNSALTSLGLDCFGTSWSKHTKYALHHKEYRKLSHVRRTKFHNLYDFRLVLQLYLPNPLKPGVK